MHFALDTQDYGQGRTAAGFLGRGHDQPEHHLCRRRQGQRDDPSCEHDGLRLGPMPSILIGAPTAAMPGSDRMRKTQLQAAGTGIAPDELGSFAGSEARPRIRWFRKAAGGQGFGGILADDLSKLYRRQARIGGFREMGGAPDLHATPTSLRCSTSTARISARIRATRPIPGTRSTERRRSMARLPSRREETGFS